MNGVGLLTPRISSSMQQQQQQQQQLQLQSPLQLSNGIGSDPSMIAANHRMESRRSFHATVSTKEGNKEEEETADSNSSDAAAMEDEYGEMTSDGSTFVQNNFELENGVVLPEVQLRYQTYGQPLNETKDNVLLICHALTGNASLHSWWGGLLGDGLPFDTAKYHILCCNILGSCYGSTSSQSVDPRTGLVYGKDFPDVSIRDTVRLQLLLLKQELGVSSVHCVIGGSLGGMQAVEFAVQAGRSAANNTMNDDIICAEDGESCTGVYTCPCLLSLLLLLLLLQIGWWVVILDTNKKRQYADSLHPVTASVH